MGSCSLSRSGTRAPLCWEPGVSVAGPPGKSLPRSSLLQISTRPCPACHRAWAPPQRSPPRSPYPTSLSSSAPLLCFLYCWKILFVSFSVARRPHQDSGRACPSCPGPHSLPAPGTGLAQSRCSANIQIPSQPGLQASFPIIQPTLLSFRPRASATWEDSFFTFPVPDC